MVMAGEAEKRDERAAEKSGPSPDHAGARGARVGSRRPRREADRGGGRGTRRQGERGRYGRPGRDGPGPTGGGRNPSGAGRRSGGDGGGYPRRCECGRPSEEGGPDRKSVGEW